MNKSFEKILERLEEMRKKSCIPDIKGYCQTTISRAEEIVQEVAKEYKGDMKHNLAEMYAKNMVDYGVDVTEAWQTATQQSCALEKAYIRGRQYEVDRFNKLRKEYNGGWIACSERLPEAGKRYLVSAIWKDKDFEKSAVYDAVYGSDGLWHSYNYEPVSYKVIAWQPLPVSYKE